ncbi:hypothetical protein GGTG_05024 [Gaeumannomyces tritici R3-111a-1]|uniref:SnoaL-like domain-containing protein n=1 Tax=Gaeumannomyces tritici (strain R3-111a-1) TaxID=644352 RepID=J3NUR8_GAET3|nr:hypothetical protein GGTG_05024 [Gaeumannomyces tritici R3-111a-1]EJT79942.1 hypothetical protein GGTG_05024 [Gaeumannomyces tritici R3-111a-1]
MLFGILNCCRYAKPKAPLTSSLFTSTRTMSTGNKPSKSAQAQAAASSNPEPSFSSLGIRNSTINEAPGVQLSPHQKLVVGSVLDLFEGNPTLKHFSLWSPDAVFEDPITSAAGEAKYKAQWYGLPALFSPITLQSHTVVDAGNPVRLETSNKYVVRGIGSAHTISSVVNIHLGDDGKIAKVQDRWNDKLPEGVIMNTFRKINAVTVPMLITVPKTEEEDMKMQAARDKEMQAAKEKEETK